MPAPNNTAARRYLDLLRHALCRDRFPDARYDMSTTTRCQVKAALDAFRAKHSIHSPVTTIDWSGIFWRK